MCEFNELGFMLDKTFLNFYRIKIKRWQELNVVIFVNDRKSKFLPQTKLLGIIYIEIYFYRYSLFEYKCINKKNLGHVKQLIKCFYKKEATRIREAKVVKKDKTKMAPPFSMNLKKLKLKNSKKTMNNCYCSKFPKHSQRDIKFNTFIECMKDDKDITFLSKKRSFEFFLKV